MVNTRIMSSKRNGNSPAWEGGGETVCKDTEPRRSTWLLGEKGLTIDQAGGVIRGQKKKGLESQAKELGLHALEYGRQRF